MKIFHTADWHLGKLVQGVYMTEDQAYVLEQFIHEIESVQPDVIIIAGDLYDRAVPPTEAVQLLNQTLDKIVLEMHIPVIAIAGNHDSPSRLHFGSRMMQEQGLHIIGQMDRDFSPVVLTDKYGEVHFHLVPYCDPSQVAHILEDESIKSHHDAAKKIIRKIESNMDPNARHVYIGHAFATNYGEAEENTSDSERPLSIGGAEYIDAHLFDIFDYTALGHLHQAHFVHKENIRYAGSILKYSVSEAAHKKGFLIVDLNEAGNMEIEKKLLHPMRDIRRVEGMLDDLLEQTINEDYVFVTLLDDTPILSPMEKIRSVFPNAMHVERKMQFLKEMDKDQKRASKKPASDQELFQGFYKEIKGMAPSLEAEEIFQNVLEDLLKMENETWESK